MFAVRCIHVLAVIGVSGILLCGCRKGPANSDEKAAGAVDKSGGSPKYNGTLDGTRDGAIVGWAYDYNRRDDAMMVVIYDGQQVLGEVKADQFRKDLADKSIGTGKYGFAFPVPASLRDGRPHEIHAKIKESDFELKKSPRKLVFK